MPPFAAILPAAGGSTRFGGPTNKLMADLAGRPVLAWSLKAFLDRRDVAQVIVPTSFAADDLRAASPILAECLADPRVRLCPGGRSRAESVRSALEHVAADVEWVAVHDAARPLLKQSLIDSVLAAAHEHGAAVPARPVALTVKEADGPLPAVVRRTVPRHSLWAMQTPQVMRRAALMDAIERCPMPLDQVTDDAQFMELVGHPVWLVDGDDTNLKITTALDLRFAQLLLEG